MYARDGYSSNYLTTVSVEAINTITQGMVESVIKYQGMEVEEMMANAEEHVNQLKAAVALDNQVVEEGEIRTVTDDSGDDTYQIQWKVRAHVKLIGASNIGEVTSNFAKAQSEQGNYNNLIAKYKDYCDRLHGSADEISIAQQEIIAELDKLANEEPTKEEPKKEEPKKEEPKKEEPKKEEPKDDDTTTDTPGGNDGGEDYSGGSPSGGDYGGGGYGGGSGGGGGGYTPAPAPVSTPTPTPTPTKEEIKEENIDYIDGDEGKEVEPTVDTPNVTIPPITKAPTPTVTQAPKPTQAAQPTQAPVEKHTGGGYSSAGGYKYDNTAPEVTEEEALQEEAASSIDNIINGRTISKIPTSSIPISKIRTTTSKGSSVIPAASGIAAAAVIGLGAKAYLDKKKAQEEEEEEEMFE